MPGEPCWGLGRKDTAPGPAIAQSHLGLSHCLTSFIWKGPDKQKAKPAILALRTALSSDLINLNLSYLDRLSRIPGEGKDMGTLLRHSEQTPFSDYFPRKVASVIFICKTFSLSSQLKEAQSQLL